jgi:hypothetical protein
MATLTWANAGDARGSASASPHGRPMSGSGGSGTAMGMPGETSGGGSNSAGGRSPGRGDSGTGAAVAPAAAYAALINDHYASTLNRTSLLVGKKYTGKVRDVYETETMLVLVTTDRQSAFDRLLACVPFKGAVLNLTSAWWFRQTAEIVPNHVIAVPHPNVTIARKCTPFRVEFVVRAYLTGTTGTSVWTHYKAGARTYCGHMLPDGTSRGRAFGGRVTRQAQCGLVMEMHG